MKPYTVIFFIDGDYHVETFVEHVTVADITAAFGAAIAQAKASGCSSSGSIIHDHEWDNATHIAVFAGHLDEA